MRRTAIGALLSALAFAPRAAQAQQPAPGRPASPVDETPAADAVSRGKAAFAAGNMHDALRAFRDAWELAKTPQIAANLGTVEASFGLHRDAAEHLRFALTHLPPSAPPDKRQAITSALEVEKQQVVTVVIHAAPAGSSIWIDDKRIGTAPMDDETYVEPGRHEVRVEQKGFKTEESSISAFAGEVTRVSVSLVRTERAHVLAAPSSLDLRSDGADSQATGRPNKTILAIGSGVALAGLGGGAIFWAVSIGAKTDAQAKHDALPPSNNACGSGTPYGPQCKELMDANRAVDRDRNIAIASFVVGGAATAGTLAYWLWPRKHADTKISAVPFVVPTYGGFQARWRW